MERWLRRSLAERSLQVHYQPIVSLRTGRIVAAEALVRGVGRNRQILAPGEFLEVARKTGQLPALDFFVLETAIAEASSWRARWGKDAPAIACNVVCDESSGRDLDITVLEILAAAGLPATSLWLEVSEEAVFCVDDSRLAMLRALRIAGVKLAVDDFGTGQSSLSRLSTLEFQVLKADIAFISALPGSTKDDALVGVIAELARTLGMRSVAEGVERPDQFEPLKRHGFTYAQGFCFARALPPAEFAALFARPVHFEDMLRLAPAWVQEELYA